MFGAPQEIVEAVQDHDPEHFEVFEENWEAVQIFLRMTTQWNRIDGAFIGLNYVALESILRVLEVENKKAVFEDIQFMEFEALRVLNSREK